MKKCQKYLMFPGKAELCSRDGVTDLASETTLELELLTLIIEGILYSYTFVICQKKKNISSIL